MVFLVTVIPKIKKITPLHNEIKKGNIVKVHAKKFIDKIPYEGLILDVFEAYETALIKKCNPKWNKQIN